MLIRSPPTTLLQIIPKLIPNCLVIVISIVDPEEFLEELVSMNGLIDLFPLTR